MPWWVDFIRDIVARAFSLVVFVSYLVYIALTLGKSRIVIRMKRTAPVRPTDNQPINKAPAIQDNLITPDYKPSTRTQRERSTVNKWSLDSRIAQWIASGLQRLAPETNLLCQTSGAMRVSSCNSQLLAFLKEASDLGGPLNRVVKCPSRTKNMSVIINLAAASLCCPRPLWAFFRSKNPIHV